MTVQDITINADLAAGRRARSVDVGGGTVQTVTGTHQIAAADSNGSTYRYFIVNSNDIVTDIRYFNDAKTGGTDFDLGLYEFTDTLTATDADLFLDGVSLASAGRFQDGTANISVENVGTQYVWELLGLTSDPQKQYWLVLTGNTIGSTAADVTIHLSRLHQA